MPYDAPGRKALLLKRAALSRPSGEWKDDDYEAGTNIHARA
jgi:hypothetical protein